MTGVDVMERGRADLSCALFFGESMESMESPGFCCSSGVRGKYFDKGLVIL